MDYQLSTATIDAPAAADSFTRGRVLATDLEVLTVTPTSVIPTVAVNPCTPSASPCAWALKKTLTRLLPLRPLHPFNPPLEIR